MANFVRRLVSGNKARFKDAELDLELDLVYVTDHILIMGYPAAGLESFYRNNRHEAKKFLEHRHGNNFWVFNFCPLTENSYEPSVFDGRVSRYPFPDHHAPPLAVLPLVAREMRQWLSGSSERVTVLHCKAGKGRSGTLACAYLLSLDESPTPPKLQRSLTTKEWAKMRADQLMESVETESVSEEVRRDEKDYADEALEKGETASTQGLKSSSGGEDSNTQSVVAVQPTTSSNTTPAVTSNLRIQKSTLDDVLALHTSRRMRAPAAPDEKPKQGVSIPSQRRWLYYWSLLLAHVGPPGFWGLNGEGEIVSARPRILVRITRIVVRMRELGTVKKHLVKFASKAIERAASARKKSTKGTVSTTTSYIADSSKVAESQEKERELGKGLVWVSLARYDDEFVQTLERWERWTRERDESSGDGNATGKARLGVMRKGSERMSVGRAESASETGGEGEEETTLRDMFKDGKWDGKKMVRSFARMGNVEGKKRKETSENGGTNLTYTLQPLSQKSWKSVKAVIDETTANSTSTSNNPLESSPQPKTREGSGSPQPTSTQARLSLQVPSPGRNSTSASEDESGNEGAPLSVVSSTTSYTHRERKSSELETRLESGSGSGAGSGGEHGLVVDAEREMRVKLYAGKVFMGWIWLIPTFHIPHPAIPGKSHTVTFVRKEVDFPIGVGAGLIDVSVEMEWC